MPNAKILTEKQAVVTALIEKLQKCTSGVLVDYKGITVAEDTALRVLLRNENVEYSVVKNTMVRFALDDVGMQELDPVLNGTTAMAISHEDPIAPMRVVSKFAKQFAGKKFVIKAGFMDGKVLPLADVLALADLPSKEILLAQVLGTMLAPITALAIVLKAIAEKDGDKTAPEAAAAEAAPEVVAEVAAVENAPEAAAEAAAEAAVDAAGAPAEEAPATPAE